MSTGISKQFFVCGYIDSIKRLYIQHRAYWRLYYRAFNRALLLFVCVFALHIDRHIAGAIGPRTVQFSASEVHTKGEKINGRTRRMERRRRNQMCLYESSGKTRRNRMAESVTMQIRTAAAAGSLLPSPSLQLYIAKDSTRRSSSSKQH